MKKTAGTLRIDLARFRELEVFTQFSSDLDKATQTALDHGKQLMEILKQPLYHPMSVSRQAVILYISTGSLLADVPLAKSREGGQGFVDYLENTQPQLLEEIESTGALSAAVAESIRAELDAYKGQVSAQWQA